MTISSTTGTWTVTWPWPKAWFLDYYTLAVAEGDWGTAQGGGADGYDSLILFELQNISDTWTGYPVAQLGDPDTITHIDVADFGKYYILSFCDSDGVPTMVARDPNQLVGDLPGEGANPIMVPYGSTCCNFKGQCLIGGIQAYETSWANLTKSGVAWGGIGQMEFRPEVDKSAGFTEMPWNDSGRGRTDKVLRLGDFVMVYGSGGVARLMPFTKDLVTGFGVVPMRGAGVGSGWHVAGDENIHCMVDNNYDLWLYDKGGEQRKLGYREWMEDLLTYTHVSNRYETIVSYVPGKKIFFFSNGYECFALTEYGMYKTHQLPVSVGVYKKRLCGFFMDSGDNSAKITLDTTDFGLRGHKTLETVEVGADYSPNGSETFLGQVDFKYDHDETFRNSSTIRINPQGVFYPGITANEFRVEVRFSDYTDGDPRVDYMTLRYKVVDKRAIRGMYAR